MWKQRIWGSRGFAAPALLACLLASGALHAQPEPNPRDARTARLCANCHRDKFAASEHNAHAVLGDEDWQARTGKSLACENCHGDTAAHIRGGGGRRNVFGFRAEPVTERNARCLACHRKDHRGFERSPHALAGLACTNCHEQHAGHAATTLDRKSTRLNSSHT